MRIQVGSATDIGRVRERNEDSILVQPPLYVVADGMGGHRGGDVASQVAIETMERLEGEDRGSLSEHVRGANRAVWERANEDQRLSGMGTTLTAVRFDGDGGVALAHVGDSRAYLMRDGSLRKLTTDHTLVERMLRSGEITEEEAEVHPHRNVMTRALGTDEQVEVDEDSITLSDGDRLLLCSDGLTGMVTEDQILAILEHSDGAQQAADRLVKAANRAGGIDNISVVVLDAIGEGDETAAPGRRVAAPSPRTVARWGLRAGLALLIVLALLFAARWWLDRQWYVGASEGSVALYQGIPLTILGFELGHPVQVYADLPAAEVRRLQTAGGFDEGISVEDRAAGEELVEQFREDLRAARRAERDGGGGG